MKNEDIRAILNVKILPLCLNSCIFAVNNQIGYL